MSKAIESYWNILKHRKIINFDISDKLIIMVALAFISFRFAEENKDIVHC